jgi:hypothetical protein
MTMTKEQEELRTFLSMNRDLIRKRVPKIRLSDYTLSFIKNSMNFHVTFPTTNLNDMLVLSIQEKFSSLKGISNPTMIDFNNINPDILLNYSLIIFNKINIIEFLKIIYEDVTQKGTNYNQEFIIKMLISFTNKEMNQIIQENIQNKEFISLLIKVLFHYISYNIFLLVREINGTFVYLNGNEEIIPKKINNMNKRVVIKKYCDLLSKIKIELKQKTGKDISNVDLFEILFSCLSTGENIMYFFEFHSQLLNYISPIRGFNTDEDINWLSLYFKHYKRQITEFIPTPIIENPSKTLENFIDEQLNIYIKITNEGEIVVSIYSMYILSIPQGMLNIESINKNYPFMLGVVVDKIDKNIMRRTIDDSFDYYWLSNSETREFMKQSIKLKINQINNELMTKVSKEINKLPENKREMVQFFESTLSELTQLTEEIKTLERWSQIEQKITKYINVFSSVMTSTPEINEWLQLTKLNEYFAEVYVKLTLLNNISFFYKYIPPLSSSEFRQSLINYLGVGVQATNFGMNKQNTLYNEQSLSNSPSSSIDNERNFEYDDNEDMEDNVVNLDRNSPNVLGGKKQKSIMKRKPTKRSLSRRKKTRKTRKL